MTEVDTKGGIVTLKGEADQPAQKDLTTEYAKDIEGVKDVNNQMTVAKSAKAARTTGDKIDDASITAWSRCPCSITARPVALKLRSLPRTA